MHTYKMVYKVLLIPTKLLQLVCTNPSTINHKLTNLRTFYCILETVKMLKTIVLCNCALP